MSELEKSFRRYSVYGGETSASSNEMTGKNFFKMLDECGVMDGNTVTSADVDIVFNKYKNRGARSLNFIEFQQAIKELSEKRFKGKSPEEALHATFKLMEGREPDRVVSTKSIADQVVERLTDTSKYTGSHKERFDERGKGKGLAGRTDIVKNTGYVAAYKGAGTYDKTH